MGDKYTKSAKGQNCTVRITGICNYDPATTVFAHLGGAGMGMKHSSIHGCDACSCCHWWLDGGYVKDSTRYQRDFEHYRAMVETQQRMIAGGVLVL